jgi:hypothetical protein
MSVPYFSTHTYHKHQHGLEKYYFVDLFQVITDLMLLFKYFRELLVAMSPTELTLLVKKRYQKDNQKP